MPQSPKDHPKKADQRDKKPMAISVVKASAVPPPLGKPDLTSVRAVTDLLDKAFKVARIYKLSNTAAKTFTEKVFTELSGHLRRYGRLTYVVQGYRLFYNGETVYENTSPLENLAFTLFVDGIRALSFMPGLSQEDFIYFLETLGTNSFDSETAETADEDIVTRLWQRNLATIAVVTAEEIVKSLDSASVLIPQDAQTLSSPVSQLVEIKAAEVDRHSTDIQEGRTTGRGHGYAYGFGTYAVSPEEQKALAQEIQEENTRDDVSYLLSILSAIMASAEDPALLSKTLELLGHVLERLIEEGNWLVLTRMLGLLQQIRARSNLPEKPKRQVKELMEMPVRPASLDVISAILNASAEAKTDSFLALLLQLTPSAVEPLCVLFTRLKHPQHRSLVGEALVMLAKDTPEPIVSRLADLKGVWVRDFIVVITRLRWSRFAEALHPLARHEKSVVRKEAVRALGILAPSGSGTPLLAFLQDTDGSIRFSVLSLLTSGQYAIPVAEWMPIVTDRAFHNRLMVEKRLVFLAMTQTCRTEAIPYFKGLVTQWLWFKRKQRLEMTLLAIETVGRLGTPEAVEVLTLGAKRRHRLVRTTCQAALAKLHGATRGHGHP